MWRPFSIPKRRLPVVISILLYLTAPVPSHAECSLAFLPMEPSKYLLKGTECEGIAAVTVTVDYDSTDLFFPQVDVMGGMLLEKDRGAATTPGSLLLHIQREDPSAGYFEVTVYFQKREDYPAVINFVTVEVTDLSGASRPIPVEMVEPSPTMNEPVPVDLAAETIAAPALTAVTTETGRKPVFERFRDFAGEKNLAAFTALFASGAPCCSQTPAVVIADGRHTAQVVIGAVEESRLEKMKDGAPLFVVKGGKLIAVKRGRQKEEWIAIVRPLAGWWDVRVSCTAADETIEFSLTVAPAIEIPPHKLAEINDKTFMSSLRSFLAGEPDKELKSAVWFREYLFTANYLAAQEGKRKLETR